MDSVYKALAHPVRRKILAMLRNRPHTAGELSDAFDLSKPTLTGHFAKLKEANLVFSDKHKTTITYRINLTVLEEVMMNFMSTFNIDKDSEGKNNR